MSQTASANRPRPSSPPSELQFTIPSNRKQLSNIDLDSNGWIQASILFCLAASYIAQCFALLRLVLTMIQ